MVLLSSFWMKSGGEWPPGLLLLQSWMFAHLHICQLLLECCCCMRQLLFAASCDLCKPLLQDEQRFAALCIFVVATAGSLCTVIEGWTRLQQ